MLLRRGWRWRRLLCAALAGGASAQQSPARASTSTPSAGAGRRDRRQRRRGARPGDHRRRERGLRSADAAPDARRRPPQAAAGRRHAVNEVVQGFEVAHERRSGVRYLADFTVHFQPDAVRQMLRQAGVGFVETPSKPVIVLAVCIRATDDAVGRSQPVARRLASAGRCRAWCRWCGPSASSRMCRRSTPMRRRAARMSGCRRSRSAMAAATCW